MLFPYGSHHLAVFLFSFPPLPICCCCQLCFLLAGASHFSLAIQFAAVLLMEVQHFSEECSLLWWWCELFGNLSKSCLCSVPVAHVHFMPCPSPLTVAPVVPKICDLVARRGTGPWWGSGVEPASPGLASWLRMWLGLRLLSFLCLISPLERSFSFPYCLTCLFSTKVEDLLKVAQTNWKLHPISQSTPHHSSWAGIWLALCCFRGA